MSDKEDARVHLEDYDPIWPARFALERQRLAEVLEPWMAGPIEHVGSTAIPGLRAKPIIDIMVAVRTLEESRPAIDVLRGLSYLYFPHLGGRYAQVLQAFARDPHAPSAPCAVPEPAMDRAPPLPRLPEEPSSGGVCVRHAQGPPSGRASVRQGGVHGCERAIHSAHTCDRERGGG